MGRDTRTPYAEFMQTWEEGYVNDTPSFEEMHTRGVTLLEGAALRGPDGRLDREKLVRYVDSILASREFFRVRLQRGVLGLTTPAWVPDEQFDLSRHIRFSEEVVELKSENLPRLSGVFDGVMPIEHPLWRVRFTELDTGDVAMGMTMHHVSSDGQSGIRLNSLMMQRSPDEPLPDAHDPFADLRAARATELPGLALRAWRARVPGFGARWRDFWSKSFYRRFRRFGGRLLRPFRDHARLRDASTGSQPPQRHTDFVILDARDVAQRATELGGTVSDLLVAAAIQAYGSPDVVSMRYPVSDRSTAKDRPRNKVTDMMLAGSADQPLAELVSSLRAQVVNRDLFAPVDPEVRARMIGYATLLPWVSSPRYFAGARVIGMAPFAAGLHVDELTLAAILYDGTLSIGVTMQADRDVAGVTSRVAELMTTTSTADHPR